MAETKPSELKVQATSEILGPCKRSLKIEVPSTTVDEEFERVTAEYVRLAHLPGFRPGRAPRPVVEKRFAKEIEEEARRRLIGRVFREAVKQQSLRPVGMPELKDVQFGRGKPLAFSADMEVEPEFTLPDYKGIPVRKPPVTVTDEDLSLIHI
ncbi:MAG: trigger factor family protein [Verrucomicrobiae bacterium]|nr:trigger factor family protein [Verrucomicrobiae bacterium]